MSPKRAINILMAQQRLANCLYFFPKSTPPSNARKAIKKIRMKIAHIEVAKNKLIIMLLKILKKLHYNSLLLIKHITHDFN